MSDRAQQTGAMAGFLTGDIEQDPPTEGTGPIVGADDAAADAGRGGGDVDLSAATRDSDGVPVGSADADADAARGGGHRDDGI
ncbi:MAG TPA: hypothetical protein VF755_09410 [Catenuloplanes sp.]|jgi:hypothetical protein